MIFPFKISPISTLLNAKDPTLTYFVLRDLLHENPDSIQFLWELSETRRIVSHQQADGSWRYPAQNARIGSPTNYSLLETYRQLRVLVDMFGFNQQHNAIQRAAQYVYSCQTPEGDIRGILGNQYMPYYHGTILELLIRAGFADDDRTIKGLQWLLDVRQNDGGWLVPAQLVPAKQKTEEFWRSAPISPLCTKPFSHIATGMVLRAFAVHKDYRTHPAAIQAAQGLKRRLFLPDRYGDRKAPEYWLKFQYPFWWPNLLTVLDILGLMDFPAHDPDVKRGLQWFIDNQEADGLWPTGYGMGSKAQANRLWVGLAICRMVQWFR